MPRTPLEDFAFGVRLGNRSVFIQDPCLGHTWNVIHKLNSRYSHHKLDGVRYNLLTCFVGHSELALGCLILLLSVEILFSLNEV